MEKIEHLYSKHQLNRFIEKYNDVLKYLKVTGKFGVDEKIVGLKRGLIFQDSTKFFRDYLDSVHKPAKKIIGKEGLHCIKFILSSGKEVVIAEGCKPDDKLPKGIYRLEDFIGILKKDQLDRYINIVNQILGEIKVNECDYFNSMEYKKKAQNANMLAILKSGN